jgi:uncharacterized protein YkwD
MEHALLAAVNETRASLNLQRLSFAERLQAGAERYARRLMSRNLFGHARLASGVAETLAWGRVRAMDPREIVRLWLESPPHRAVLLWPEARRVGLGVRIGRFLGHPSISLAVGRFSR